MSAIVGPHGTAAWRQERASPFRGRGHGAGAKAVARGCRRGSGVKARIERAVGARVSTVDAVAGRGYTQALRLRAQLDDGRRLRQGRGRRAAPAGSGSSSGSTPRFEAFLPRLLGVDEDEPPLALEDLGDGLAAAARRRIRGGATLAGAAPPPPTVCRAALERRAGRRRSGSASKTTRRRSSRSGSARRPGSSPPSRPRRGVAVGGPRRRRALHFDVRSDNLCLPRRPRPPRRLEPGVRRQSALRRRGVAAVAARRGWSAARGAPAGRRSGARLDARGLLRGRAPGCPPPATAPTVRTVQLAQLQGRLPWAARALGLPEPE